MDHPVLPHEPPPPPDAVAPQPRHRRNSDGRLTTAETQFAYPRNASTCNLRFSRKGQKLADAMSAWAEPRLLPKLQARTGHRPEASQYTAVAAVFLDACVYLHAWLEHPDEFGAAEFPFARLYPVKGSRYNLSVRRLIDWSRAEDYSVSSVDQLFFMQAPKAKFWIKVATHKTFEECIDLLVREETF
jgi:hypothetical protein